MSTHVHPVRRSTHVPNYRKIPMPVILALTLLPATMIGATLWIVGGLVPACTIEEKARLTSPDQRYDLVVFSRSCGDTSANTQAALVPPQEEVPFDAASFYSIAAAAELKPAWVSATALELTAPADFEPLRADPMVAGVSVTYH